MAAVAPRRPAASVPSITGLVISPPGVKANLVDISASGLLADAGVPVRIGQAVKITFEGTFDPPSAEARVVRSSVAAMTSAGVRYHVGLSFNTPIALDDEPPSEPGPQPVILRQARDEPEQDRRVEGRASEPKADSPRAGDLEKVAGGFSPVAEARPPSPPPAINRW